MPEKGRLRSAEIAAAFCFTNSLYTPWDEQFYSTGIR